VRTWTLRPSEPIPLVNYSISPHHQRLLSPSLPNRRASTSPAFQPIMLVSPSHAGALRRLLLAASIKSAPVSLAGAATRFSLALPIRAFSVGMRSAFPAAATKKTTPAATATKKPTTSSKRTTATKITKKTAKPTAKAAPAKNHPGRPKSKKKAAAAVKAPRKKKPLTPEAKNLNERRSLKRALIKSPDFYPTRPWNIFCSQEMVGQTGIKVTDSIKDLSAKYKSLDAAELEKLKAIGEKNKIANKAAHRTWVEQHSIADVKAHNLARNRLAKKFNFHTNVHAMDDHRVPKRPSGSFGYYTTTRWASGELAGIPIPEASKRMSSEWNAMSDAQKQPYIDHAEAAHAQWLKEVSKLKA
jgi:hypothetical protein